MGCALGIGSAFCSLLIQVGPCTVQITPCTLYVIAELIDEHSTLVQMRFEFCDQYHLVCRW
jgi:hypothetical protein